MTEFCSISIVAFGILAIGLHLSALIQSCRQSRRRLPTRYLPPASRPLALRTEIKHNTPVQGHRGELKNFYGFQGQHHDGGSSQAQAN